MADDAFNQSLVLHVDDDGEREVIGFAPGPAGVAEIELAPGTHLSVDYAEPTTLCSIRTTRAADPRVIASVIGDDATEIVMSTPPTDRPVRIELSGRRRFSNDPEIVNRKAREFRLAAVLASLVDDATRHEFARGIAGLELAEQVARLDVPEWASEWMTDAAHVRAIALLQDGIDALARAEAIGPGALDQVSRLLGEVPDNSPVVLQARELRREIRSVSRRSTAAAAAARPSPAMGPPLVDRMAAPIPLPVGHFPARFDAAAAGRWARLIDGTSLELVAIAPIRTDRGETRADLLVSPMLDWSRLESDACAEPLTAPDSVTAVRRAVRLGRRAVEAEVIHRRSAADAWRMCAGAWRAIGDEHRATVADRHAPRPVGRRPMLNERIGLAVGAA
jgi:hypothetical protein